MRTYRINNGKCRGWASLTRGLCLAAISAFLPNAWSPVMAASYYVDASGGNDTTGNGTDGNRWASISRAVGAASSGDTIYVYPGVYGPITTANLNITIRSVDSATNTVINGGGSARCATLGSAPGQNQTKLRGFTLRNGNASSNGDGGGVYGGQLFDCVITGNTARDGGGAFFSVLDTCIVSSNNSTRVRDGGGGGGGLYKCRADYTVITGNVALDRGGGAFCSTNTFCEISHNESHWNGGGMYHGKATCCKIFKNKAGIGGTGDGNRGGGAFGEGVINVTIDPLVLENCLIVDNYAGDAGGIYGGSSTRTYNCTVVGNRSINNPAGIDDGTHYNTIVWDNKRTNGSVANTSGVTLNNCCTTFDPLFVDNTGDINGDYRLLAGSPCINAGNNANAKPPYDLDGRTRIVDVTVDIGAYECQMEWSAVVYVADGFGDDANNGETWEEAVKTISRAAQLVPDGGLVVVSNGVYGAFHINTNRTVRFESLNGADVTIVDANFAGRCATLGTNGVYNIVADGFTFRNGSVPGTSATTSIGGGVLGGRLENCVVTNCAAYDGGGVYGAALEGCELAGNTAARYGGGAYNCDLLLCKVTGNVSSNQGAGLWGGKARNCLIARNELRNGTAANGMGTHGTTTINCTIAYNRSNTTGGGSGVNGGTHYNSIIYYNARSNGTVANRSGGTYYNCFSDFSSPLNNGNINTPADPAFANGPSGDFNLLGGSPCIDAGNDAYITSPGPAWWGDLDGEDRIFGARVDIGAYEYLTWRPMTIYVDTATGSDDNDGLSWETAKLTLQNGVRSVANNGEVFVARGTYAPFNSLNRPIRIEGVGGASVTLINGGSASRCATLGMAANQNRTVLKGFTLTNGLANASAPGGAYGGGAFGGTLQECVIARCQATQGGGVYRSILDHCDVRGNTADRTGGGAHSATLRFCTVSDNQTPGTAYQNYGGGAYQCTLENCLVLRNTSGSNGGGTYQGTTRNCTIVKNTVRRSVGSSVLGGGTYQGTHYNTLIWDNRRGQNADFNLRPLDNRNGGTLYNCCTTASPSSSGVNPARNNNVIDAPDLISPVFIDAEVDNFRIWDSSCCFNRGSNAYVLWNEDLDGELRIRDSIVDIGCYENNASAPREVYVKPSGNNDKDGTSWAEAKATIQAGLLTVAPGGIVHVTNGVYMLPITSRNKTVRIESVNGAASTFITASGRTRPLTLATRIDQNNTVVAGFTVNGGNVRGSGGGVYGGTLEDCHITGNIASSYGGGTYYSNLDRCTLSGNRASRGAAAYYGRIWNCLILRNDVNGGYGATFNCEVRNCTVVENFTRNSSTSSGIAGVYGGTCQNSIVLNNYRTGNGQLRNHNANIGTPVGVRVRMDFNCTAPLPAIGAGNIDVIPAFINPTLANYRLRDGSPCIDRGSNALIGGLYTLDRDRNRRIIGGTVDLGAFEWGTIPDDVAVTYHWNDGSGTNVTTASGATYNPPPDPARAGYAFLGWYTNATVMALPPITRSTPFTPNVSPRDVYAHWKPTHALQNITVIYYDGITGGLPSGQGSEFTRRDLREGDHYPTVLPPTTPPYGYMFDGWYSLDGTKVTTDWIVTSATPAVLVAHWVSWTSGSNVVYFGNGGSPEWQIIPATGGAYVAPSGPPSRAGYTFCGWYAEQDPALITPAMPQVVTGSPFTPGTSPQELYAYWVRSDTLTSVTVTFYNGLNPAGTEPVTGLGGYHGRVTQYGGTPYTLLAPPPAPAGYVFDGWFTTNAPSAKVTESWILSAASPNVLVARWAYDSVNYVIYVGNGGLPAIQLLAPVAGRYPPAVLPTRPNHTFLGWYTEADPALINPSMEQVTTNTVFVPGVTPGYVYAYWKLTSELQRDCTITYYTGVRNGLPDPTSPDVYRVVTKTEGQPYAPMPAAPAAPNSEYVFAGWYSLTGAQVTDEWIVSKASPDTLIAYWTLKEPDPKLVTYIGNSTFAIPARQQTLSTDVYVMPPRTPTRVDINPWPLGSTTTNVFLGWYEVANAAEIDESMEQITGSTPFIPGSSPVEVFAYWKATNSLTSVSLVYYDGLNPARDGLAAAGLGNTAGTYNNVPEGSRYGSHRPVDPVAPADYEFTGWYSTNDVLVTADWIVSTKTPTTLVAGWRYTGIPIILPPGPNEVYYWGNGGAPDFQKVEFLLDTYLMPPVTPTRTGFRFAGWYAVSNPALITAATPQITATTPYFDGHSPQEVYAYWQSESGLTTPVTLTYYNGMSGGVPVASPALLGGLWFSVELYPLAKYPNAPAPAAPAGYRFDGWVTTNGVMVTTDWIVSDRSPTVLVARWTPLDTSHSVTYHWNDGSLYAVTIQATDKYVPPASLPTREGYYFAGWYAEQDPALINAASVQITHDTPFDPDTSAKHLYALWLQGGGSEVEITYYDGLGIYGLGSPLPFATRTAVTGSYYPYVSAPTTAPLDFVFLGWFAPDGQRVDYLWIVTATSPRTLTARWGTREDYRVTYYGNGGSPEKRVIPASVNYVVPVPNPVRPGYTFAGWYAEQDPALITAETEQITSDTPYSAALSPYELWALWKETAGLTDITVTFYDGLAADRNVPAAGLGNWMGVITQFPGSYYSLLAEPFAPAGYRFDGWYTTNATPVKVTGAWILSDASPDVLVARWAVDDETYGVTYHGNGGTPAEQRTVSTNLYVMPPQAPALAGHTFLGWYAEEDPARINAATLQATATTPFLPGESPTDVYAYWRPTEHVATNTNIRIRFYDGLDAFGLPVTSGTGTLVGQGFRAEGAVYGTLLSDQAAFLDPVPGYAFAGWFTTGGVQVLPDWIVSDKSPATLVAHWEPTSVPPGDPSAGEVFYYGNGGKPVLQKVDNSASATYVMPRTTPARDGYLFAGWYAAMSVTAGAEQFTASTPYTDGVSAQKLYAYWVDETTATTTQVTLRYYTGLAGNVPVAPGLTGAAWATASVYPATRYPDMSPPPAPVGYAFLGWFTTNGVRVASDWLVSDKSPDVLIARWEVVPNADHLVAYHWNDGSGYVETLAATGHYVTPAKPERISDNLYFAGWYAEANAALIDETTPQITVDTPFNPLTSARDVYALWLVDDGLPVTLDYYDGLGGLSPYATVSVPKGSGYPDVAPPDYAPAGSLFLGWFTPDGHAVTASWIVSAKSPRTLIAHWSAGNNVTYYGNGGSPEMRVIPAAATYVVPATEPARPGHTFVGWYAEQNPALITAATPQITGDTPFDPATSATEVWALWHETSGLTDITVNFYDGLDSGGTAPVAGNGNWVGVITQAPGTRYSLLAAPPAPDGYRFSGWYSTGGIQVTGAWLLSASTPDVLVARWAEDTASHPDVAFYGNGGLPTVQVTQAAAGLYVMPPVTPALAAHVFLGWYAEADAALITAATLQATATTPFVPGESPTDLYAYWRRAEHVQTNVIAVSYYNGIGGGLGAFITAVTKAEGAFYAPMQAAPAAPAGYEFTGWYSTNGVHVLEDWIVSAVSPTTLVAGWRPTGEPPLEPEEGEVFYFGNGGAPTLQIVGGINAHYVLPPATPARAGHWFGGWYAEANPALINADAAQITALTPYTEGVSAQKAYAYWMDEDAYTNTYTVVYYDGLTVRDAAGTGVPVPLGQLGSEFGRASNLSLPTTYPVMTSPKPAPALYRFTGWFTTNGVQVTSDWILTDRSPHVLVAHWEPKGDSTRAVTYHWNDGSGYTELTFATGTYVMPSHTPIRTGYYFAGWYAEADGNLITEATRQYTADTPFDPLTSPKNLYALWRPWEGTMFTLYYDDGLSGVFPPAEWYLTVQQPEGHAYPDVSAPDYAPTGYTFLGWFTTDGTEVTSAWIVSDRSPKHLVAHWGIVTSGDLTLVITSIVVTDTHVTITVKTPDPDMTRDIETYNIVLKGTQDLGTTFSGLDASPYPGTFRHNGVRRGTLRGAGEVFTFPKPEPDKFFFRAALTP